MDGFTIRPVRPEDHERLGDLTAAAYLDDGLLDLGAEDPYLEVLRDVGRRAEHAEVLVAVDPDGLVLGGVAFVGAPGPFADIARDGEARVPHAGRRSDRPWTRRRHRSRARVHRPRPRPSAAAASSCRRSR